MFWGCESVASDVCGPQLGRRAVGCQSGASLRSVGHQSETSRTPVGNQAHQVTQVCNLFPVIVATRQCDLVHIRTKQQVTPQPQHKETHQDAKQRSAARLKLLQEAHLCRLLVSGPGGSHEVSKKSQEQQVHQSSILFPADEEALAGQEHHHKGC